MYCGIKKKEKMNTAMLLTSMSEHEQSKKISKVLEDSQDNADTINLS